MICWIVMTVLDTTGLTPVGGVNFNLMEASQESYARLRRA
jgi:hypothetical protein